MGTLRTMRAKGAFGYIIALCSSVAWAQGWPSLMSEQDLFDAFQPTNVSRFNYTPTAAPDAGTHACSVVEHSNTAVAGTRGIVVEAAVYASNPMGKVNLNVNFRTGSDQLDSQATALLDNLAKVMNDSTYAASAFVIAGHTDARGDLRRNLELSCARAISVRNALIARGVDGSRLGVYGFGPNRQIESKPDSLLNRRVEVQRAN